MTSRKPKTGVLTSSGTDKTPLVNSRPPAAPSKAKTVEAVAKVNSNRKSNTDKNTKSQARPLGKSLSRSHDNLSASSRKRAVPASLANNKENLKDKTGTPKTKIAKTTTGAPVRKCNSAQSINNTDGTIRRSQSVHNISKVPSAPNLTEPTVKIKKASSAHNITNKSGARQARIVAPGNAMAYNAELLANFEKEKKVLERRISEGIQLAENRKTENEKLKFEIKNLKERIQPDMLESLEVAQNENRLLKDKLSELGISVEHVTDSEKLSLLSRANEVKDNAKSEDLISYVKFTTVHRPDLLDYREVGALANPELGHSVGDLSFITPEHPSSLSLDNSNWDRSSNKSDALSEISVACLQDRILQMEETHYCTNEELQATVQELVDLQDTVNELTSENEELTDEKTLLLDSLCSQTEKLENCRMLIEHLKDLLVSESERGDRSESERQLVALVRSSEEEREELLLKQTGLVKSLHNMENENKELQDIVTAVRDKTRILELKNENVLADKRAGDKQISELKEQTAKDHIEIQRYKTLLENEKQKVAELEQERNATDKSDLEELLASTRQEKERLEEKLANSQEDLAVCKNNVAKLLEQKSNLEQELKMASNNAKTHAGDMEYRLQQKDCEKVELQQEIETLRDHIDQLQLDCDRYLDGKKTYIATIHKIESDMKTSKLRVTELENELAEQNRKFIEEREEWKQFQADLQTAVVIANEIKIETQEDMERIIADRQYLMEKTKAQQEEVAKLRQELDRHRLHKTDGGLMFRNDIRGRVMNTSDRELSVLRQGRKLSDPKSGNQSLTVKHFIASLEDQGKIDATAFPESESPVSQTNSRRNSADSTVSLTSLKSDSSPPKLGLDRRSSASAAETHLIGVLRKPSENKDRSPLSHRQTIANIIYESVPVTDDAKAVSPGNGKGEVELPKKPLQSILTNKGNSRRTSAPDDTKVDKVGLYSSHTIHGMKNDPLSALAKQMGGSKRNALLKWCQNKTALYSGVDITNFSSSWNDGLAFCALMHTYLPDCIPFKELNSQDKMRNFTASFKAAESVGIYSTLNISDLVAIERPDWQAVMAYVTSIYKHFEVDKQTT